MGELSCSRPAAADVVLLCLQEGFWPDPIGDG